MADRIEDVIMEWGEAQGEGFQAARQVVIDIFQEVGSMRGCGFHGAVEAVVKADRSDFFRVIDAANRDHFKLKMVIHDLVDPVVVKRPIPKALKARKDRKAIDRREDQCRRCQCFVDNLDFGDRDMMEAVAHMDFDCTQELNTWAASSCACFIPCGKAVN